LRRQQGSATVSQIKDTFLPFLSSSQEPDLSNAEGEPTQAIPHLAAGQLSDRLRIQRWATLRRRRAPMATWIMASDTSRRRS
jgi:hypothetical protein